MELREGMKLELIKDLDCGVKVITSGEIGDVTKVDDNKVSIVIEGLGMGVFSKSEIDEYFEEYIEKKISVYDSIVDEDVNKVIQNENVTVVILNSGIKGVTKCLPYDKYDSKIGYRVAYLKAKIKEMTKELKSY